MVQPDARVVRIFNNNAVLVRVDDVEFVLAGRGIGFGKKPGDTIPSADAQRQFIEASPDKIDFLKSANALDPMLVETVSAAVDLATDLLGDLDPSVYVVLADHLSFAIQRHRGGMAIQNKLVSEIKVAFPTEFATAEILTQYVNSKLDVDLPVDETAFIALHLNAARTGSTVKQPLNEANVLGGIVADVQKGLNVDADSQLEELLSTIRRIINRVHAKQFRENAASRGIEAALPEETNVARAIIQKIADPQTPSVMLRGEVAHFAVFLHGWRQTAAAHRHK